MRKVNISERMKNVAKISGGTMLGQLISVVTLPIFTRLYGATIMGDWALITSIATIANTVSDLGLSNAVMIEEDEEETEKLFSVITTIVLLVSIIVGAFYGMFYTLTPPETNIKPLFYAVFIGMQIFTQQQVQLSYSWLNRKKQYNVLMKNPLINYGSQAIIAIPLALLGMKTYGYYIALLMGQIITLIHMRRKLPKVFLNFNISDYKRLIKRHIEFCKFQMPANITTQVKNQMPTILIKMLFGTEMLGYYSISFKVLNMPISLLANAIGKVYYQTIAEMKRKGQEIGEYTIRNMNKAMKMAALPMMILLSLSDIGCEIIFGADYIVAGNITRIISFYCFFTFLLMATQGIAIVLHKQNYNLISTVLQMIGYILGLCCGKIMFNSIYVGCLLMMIPFCIIQTGYFVMIFKSIHINPTKYLSGLLKNVSVIVIGAVCIRIVTNLLGITNGI